MERKLCNSIIAGQIKKKSYDVVLLRCPLIHMGVHIKGLYNHRCYQGNFFQQPMYRPCINNSSCVYYNSTPTMILISTLCLQTRSSEQHTTNISIPKKHSFQMVYSIGKVVKCRQAWSRLFNYPYSNFVWQGNQPCSGKDYPRDTEWLIQHFYTVSFT